jgi:hypothetical protein
VTNGTRASILVAVALSGFSTASAADYVVKSPSGGLTLSVTPDGRGAVTYSVRSGRVLVLERGALGLVTSQGDFTSGLRLVRQARAVIDETYKLPVGKRSTYVNRANELTLTFAKDGREVNLILRAYDDGLAFRYVLPEVATSRSPARGRRSLSPHATSRIGASRIRTTTGTRASSGRSRPSASRCPCWPSSRTRGISC